MGFSYPWEDDTPAMCFNGAKSWQLGWYSDKHTTIDGRGPWSGKLTGIDNYKYKKAKTVILKIETQEFEPDLYVMFNHAAGINADTKEGANQVLVTEQFRDHSSNLLAKMNEKDEFTIDNFDDTGEKLVIKIDKINLSAKQPYAKVIVNPRLCQTKSCKSTKTTKSMKTAKPTKARKGHYK